ncbi:hypothetical protein I6I18_09565 [Kytococcus sedentarius]|uniref:Uncharacterized protein n=3 Tax=Micrococcales TaxID=85006 RepID=A0A2H1JKP2_BREAU|nr:MULTISPECIES: hypothetical protein [Micrococcales]MDN5716772.1 hypothetical protein [Janibacter sp.]ACV07345.1 hypothetical protein Ksed_23750 [Kytococcus sedentarius DSM 20547]MDN5738401.1 hypothetical protein [Brevibacterium aurantiacum]QQB63303.1 hypothetical protein I6I18_09565 [Kytococcus sedentarius]SMX87838.1 hypothetical protein BAURA86_01783 [Brevibacterium aurantiacum]
MDFKEPLSGWFTHLAWNIDLRRSGPFVRASGRRGDYRHRLVQLAARLAVQSGVDTAHALEVTVIPPIKGCPEYDLALLVRSEEPLHSEIVARTRELGFPEPVHALMARNAGLFGDTEAEDGEILLNHFTGTATPSIAVEAWKSVSTWYADKLGVDNSTLLEYTGESPFLIMNYARLPGKVVPFLAGQLTRPSFYRVVRGQLHEVGITPFPLFARRVHA